MAEADERVWARHRHCPAVDFRSGTRQCEVGLKRYPWLLPGPGIEARSRTSENIVLQKLNHRRVKAKQHLIRSNRFIPLNHQAQGSLIGSLSNTAGAFSVGSVPYGDEDVRGCQDIDMLRRIVQCFDREFQLLKWTDGQLLQPNKSACFIPAAKGHSVYDRTGIGEMDHLFTFLPNIQCKFSFRPRLSLAVLGPVTQQAVRHLDAIGVRDHRQPAAAFHGIRSEGFQMSYSLLG